MRCYPTQEMRYANYPSTTDCELLQPHLPMVFFLPFIRTNYLKTAKQMERESKSTELWRRAKEEYVCYTVSVFVLCCVVCWLLPAVDVDNDINITSKLDLSKPGPDPAPAPWW